jgi:signal transduction histidine kinase/ligand-binding sensor domain-containing protein
MRRKLRTAVLLASALSAAPAAHALDPARATSQYVIRDWDTDAGLPSPSVHALLQTRDHYVWLGTSAGLVRFDGARFVVFDARNTPGFGDGVVSTLSEGADGSLNIGTTSSVMQYRDGVFEALPLQTGAGVASSLLAARNGALWIGLIGRPLFRWEGGRIVSLNKELGTLSAISMHEDADGTVWIGTRGKGLIRFDHGVPSTVDVGADIVQALRRDRRGGLWIGTPHGLLHRGEDGHIDRYTQRDGLSHDNISAVLEDRDGNLWVGTRGGGLNRRVDGRWTSLQEADGLSDDDVRCLMEDHEGNIWVGTANGLSRLSEGRFITYGPREGIPDTAVSAAAPGADGSVWIGTAAAGLAHLKNGRLDSMRLPGGLDTGAVLVLHEARDGRLWVSADDGRLFSVQKGAVREETPREGKVTAVFEERGREPLFFVRAVGLATVANRHAVAVNAAATRLSYVYGMHRDRQGTLWLCGAMGLGRLRGDDFTILGTAEGLPHNRVRSISEDEDGSLWLATIGGLAHLQGTTVHAVTTEQGLPENHLRFVADDGHGYLWLASVARIFRLEKAELRRLFEGRVKKVSPTVFDTTDGLRSTETLLSSNPGFLDADGRLWLATARGVSVTDPARPAVGESAPPVRIESLRVDGRQEKDHRYPPGRGEVTVDYAAPTLRASGKVRFRYRLEGFDDEWFDAGTQRQARFSSLPAGRYRFAVMASNPDGVWNGEAAGVGFEIARPFHQRPTFYAVCAGALLALVGGAYRLRLARMSARFDAVLGERARIARELHDTLAQSLTGMGMQIEAALGTLPPERETTRARGHLQRARSMVSGSLAELRRSIWVLRAQADTAALALDARLAESLTPLAAQSDARLSFSVTGQARRALSPEAERNLLRIAHEAVTNAVRHAGARTIEVGLEYEDAGVRLSVRDDGRGFDPEATAVATRAEHFGLVGMAERASIMNGALRVESRMGGGTEVRCRLPYDAATGSEEGTATPGPRSRGAEPS